MIDPDELRATATAAERAVNNARAAADGTGSEGAYTVALSNLAVAAELRALRLALVDAIERHGRTTR